MKVLVDYGEFKRDKSQQMGTANDNVWDEYIKVKFSISVFQHQHPHTNFQIAISFVNKHV